MPSSVSKHSLEVYVMDSNVRQYFRKCLLALMSEVEFGFPLELGHIAHHGKHQKRRILPIMFVCWRAENL